jgi:hypothetical protein
MKVILILFLFLVMSCSSANYSRPILRPDGEMWYETNCEEDIEVCHENAAKTCDPKEYQVMDKGQTATPMPVYNSHTNQTFYLTKTDTILVFKCK